MKPPACRDVLSCIDSNPEFRQALQKRLSVASDPIDSHNICRIHVHTRSFDWTQPPNRNKGSQGTGTGFILSSTPSTTEIYIVTAHHVVANSVKINVNFAKISSEYVEAKLVGCNVDMDVAVIAIDDSDFTSLMRSKYANIGLHAGNSDRIGPSATVTAHGFALGSTQLQTTKGVVSARVDNPSRLQTDVAVNPGNSGGPLLDERQDNKVVGIVTSGRTDAQGINFVAPITESNIMITRIIEQYLATGRVVYDRMATLNCAFTKSNRVLLNSIDECNSGVYTTTVHPFILYPQTRSRALLNIIRNASRHLQAMLTTVRAELTTRHEAAETTLSTAASDAEAAETTLSTAASEAEAALARPKPTLGGLIDAQIALASAAASTLGGTLNRQLVEADSIVLRNLQRLLESPDDFKSAMTHGRWAALLSSHGPPMSNALRRAVMMLLQNDSLQDGDIVCTMIVAEREYDIDLQMTAKFDFWHDRVNFQSIFDRMACSEREQVQFKFFRGGSLLTARMALRPTMNKYRKMFADADDVPYLVLAGVFVMPLMHNHIPLFRNEPLHTLLTRPDSKHLSILVVTHILPESPFNECESIGVGDVLVSINGELATSIEDARDLWLTMSSTAPVVTLRMRDGSLATASRERIRETNDRIVTEYKSDEYVGFHVVRPNLSVYPIPSSPPASPPSGVASPPASPEVAPSDDAPMQSAPIVASPDDASGDLDTSADEEEEATTSDGDDTATIRREISDSDPDEQDEDALGGHSERGSSSSSSAASSLSTIVDDDLPQKDSQSVSNVGQETDLLFQR